MAVHPKSGPAPIFLPLKGSFFIATLARCSLTGELFIKGLLYMKSALMIWRYENEIKLDLNL